MAYLELESLKCGSVRLSLDFNLEVEQGEMMAFLGPSGCGKSTTLRMVAGLDRPDAGHIRLDGQDVTTTPPHKRRAGMVFQDYALFPNMTAAENIQFGPMIAGIAATDRAKRVRELAHLAALQDVLSRYPHQLSGGQRQRAALVRALATESRVLLLDEPLSALDAPIRASLRAEIRRIQQQVHIATIYTLIVPAEHVGLTSSAARELNSIHGPITLKTFHGPLTPIEVSDSDHRWLALLPTSLAAPYSVGQSVSLSISPDHCYAINGA
jgi:ABC-type Fe3+/spermidine/putrescine transport system ATPase subunit